MHVRLGRNEAEEKETGGGGGEEEEKFGRRKSEIRLPYYPPFFH